MKEFRFNYLTMSIKVTIDDFNFAAQVGPIRKYRFALSDLVNYYLLVNAQYYVLMITYLNEKGKTKKLMIYSQYNEPKFKELNEELDARCGSKSLNHLDKKEALKVMKTSNPAKKGAVMGGIILFVIFSLGFYPKLLHYFDFGFDTVTVDDIASGKFPSSHNVKISGHPLSQAMESTVSSDNSSSVSKTVYVPLVNESWQEGNPVKVMLEFDDISEDEYNGILEQTEFVGVIRNIGWEGMKSKYVDFFKSHFSMNMPATPVLIEVTGKEHNDGWVIYAWGGVLVFLGFILFIGYQKTK
ncbi:MAG TPA: hypothetical protein VFU15_14560 [Bacteroidia bacterium]|nr:hypothetical protein [Bacteroidia bacterium]